jgi:hypothetical protein
VDNWKQSFLEKLHKAQLQCAKQFEEALDRAVLPVFDDLVAFLSDNGFRASTPRNEQGCRSFKAELAENAYILMIFRFLGIGEFELRTETFVPGIEPVLEKRTARVADIDEEWSRRQFQTSLDALIDLLLDRSAAAVNAELAPV